MQRIRILCMGLGHFISELFVLGYTERQTRFVKFCTWLVTSCFIILQHQNLLCYRSSPNSSSFQRPTSSRNWPNRIASLRGFILFINYVRGVAFMCFFSASSLNPIRLTFLRSVWAIFISYQLHQRGSGYVFSQLLVWIPLHELFSAQFEPFLYLISHRSNTASRTLSRAFV